MKAHVVCSCIFKISKRNCPRIKVMPQSFQELDEKIALQLCTFPYMKQVSEDDCDSWLAYCGSNFSAQWSQQNLQRIQWHALYGSHISSKSTPPSPRYIIGTNVDSRKRNLIRSESKKKAVIGYSLWKTRNIESKFHSWCLYAVSTNYYRCSYCIKEIGW